MTDHHRTLLDDLDDAPMRPAPVGSILLAGQSAKRRKTRATALVAAAATSLVLGSSILVTDHWFTRDETTDTVIADSTIESPEPSTNASPPPSAAPNRTTLLCDPGQGTPQAQPGCPDPRPTTGWLTVTETGDLHIRHFATLHNDAKGKAHARREGLDFPFANDYLDVPTGSSTTLQLAPDTTCSGINQVGYRSPLTDHPVECSELLDAAEAYKVPVAIWRDGPSIVQVSELYRP